jgi:N-acetylmuramoyl-L-alanine amidase
MRPGHQIPSAVAGAALLLSSFIPLGAQPANAVTAVRFWSLNDITRIVIETTGEFTFKSDRIQDPDRVYFDLVGARPRIGRKGLNTITVADRLVKQIRVAETQPGTTRVVFDLERDVEYSASQLSDPNRLIVELRAAGPSMPDAPLTMSVTGGQKLDEALTDSRYREKPAMPPPPALVRSEPRLDTIADPTRAKEVAAAAIASARVPPAKPAARPMDPKTEIRLEPAPRLETAKLETSKLGPPKPDFPALEPVARPESTKPIIPVAPPKAARLSKRGDQSLTRVLGLKVGRIVIDAGHGGHDTGTNGPSGLTEKDLVLDVAKRLGALIESRLGSEVIYTRTDDTYIPLEARTQLANDRKADLFLSIHANSSPIRSASGVESYYLNFTTAPGALEVAARENAASQKTVYELKDLLQKIAMKDKVEESKEFAARIQTSLYALSVHSNARAKDRGVKKAPFVVLIGASMPSVLAEIGFISNPKDENLMRRPEFRQKIADALYKGLSQYASTLSHFQMASK